MPAPSAPRPTVTPSPRLASTLYRLTVRQYERMIEDGTIDEGERVELIEGLVVVKGRRNRSDIVAGNKGLRALWRIMPPGWYVAKAFPIVASNWSKPEPDLAVIRGVVDDDDDDHERAVTAADVALVVKIADASLAADRLDLARVYASAGIPVYWIVNLAEEQVEIWSDPRRDGYHAHQVLGRGEDVPVVVAGTEAGWIAVTDVLP